MYASSTVCGCKYANDSNHSCVKKCECTLACRTAAPHAHAPPPPPPPSSVPHYPGYSYGYAPPPPPGTVHTGTVPPPHGYNYHAMYGAPPPPAPGAYPYASYYAPPPPPPPPSGVPVAPVGVYPGAPPPHPYGAVPVPAPAPPAAAAAAPAAAPAPHLTKKQRAAQKQQPIQPTTSPAPAPTPAVSPAPLSAASAPGTKYVAPGSKKKFVARGKASPEGSPRRPQGAGSPVPAAVPPQPQQPVAEHRPVQPKQPEAVQKPKKVAAEAVPSASSVAVEAVATFPQPVSVNGSEHESAESISDALSCDTSSTSHTKAYAPPTHNGLAGHKPARSQLLGILNKISDTKYHENLTAVYNLIEHNHISIEVLVSGLYEQVVQMPSFAALYSRLCVDLSQKLNPLAVAQEAARRSTKKVQNGQATGGKRLQITEETLKVSPFRRELVKKCQKKVREVLSLYDHPSEDLYVDESDDDVRTDTGASDQRTEHDSETTKTGDDLTLGDVRGQKALLTFISNLHMKALISSNVVMRITTTLLASLRASLRKGTEEPAQLDLLLGLLSGSAALMHACPDHQHDIEDLYKDMASLAEEDMCKRSKFLLQGGVEHSPMEAIKKKEAVREMIRRQMGR